MVLTLPFPPSNNRYWRHITVAGKPRTLISKAGRAYRSEIIGLVLEAGKNKGLTGRLAIDIHAYPPDKRRRDLDNIFKALLDSLQHAGVYLDDEQIDSLRIARHQVIPGGEVAVYITEVG